jgi:DNA-binding LacI/PurR family transcriptional regulator
MAKKEPKERNESRQPTMADIAELVGVSRQLVGLVFRGAPGVGAETEVKIRAAAKELGYRPNLAAQSLRREGSKYIGVVFHAAERSTNEIIPVIYKHAGDLGFQVVISAISSDRTDQEAIDEVIGHRCDGLILIASTLSVTRLQKLARTIPLVSLGRRLSGVRAGVVSSHGEVGVFDAVEYLIGLGHKSIAYVNAKDMLDNEYRLEGYESAMDKAKLKKTLVTVTGDFAENGGARAANKILALDHLPTAVVCNNDQSAFGLIHRFLQAGVKVPADVSVIGYDDTVAQLPFLDLTTVRQDPEELARAAVDDLSARIKGDKYLSETFLTSSKLLVRTSTCQPREQVDLN